jgi:hypothetical protein
MRSFVLAAMAVCSLAPALAHAQATTPPRPRAAAAQQPLLRAYFTFDTTTLTAADTFDAVIGRSRLSMPGGGAELLRIWKGLFARVAFASAKETGSRVVVFDDEVIDLGIPLTVELAPLEIAGGWRFPAFAGRRLVPYAGAGLLRMSYRETSDFAMGDDNTDTVFNGGVVFGGIEAALVSWVIAGAEVQYRTVPDALGEGGVSQVFGDTDLGGVTVRVLVGIRR